ncbi:histone-lysine N-methyltransferase SETMAR-like [Melitaea cinxia]|uniref:histone-lysine N-methyltransferase SETMAR-like n=1 Tax=Melitaea cinxia TaxID=113334 RepID=UPI001E270661|nr:histone-lysine N-methyltransferase SETMAR-like [Melitaea cinxia]
MEYEFRRGSKAAERARNINDVYDANTTNDRTTRYWFARFCSGNFDLRNEPRGRPKILVDNDELKAIVEKLDKWVPHEFNERQREIRAETCLALLNRHANEGILNGIVFYDEKWILFDNHKCSASWLDPGSVPKQCPKRKMIFKKVMVAVWWSSAGVIRYSFLPNGMSTTSDINCEELNTIMGKLARLQPVLVNRSAPLLLHDNARPRTAQ